MSSEKRPKEARSSQGRIFSMPWRHWGQVFSAPTWGWSEKGLSLSLSEAVLYYLLWLGRGTPNISDSFIWVFAEKSGHMGSLNRFSPWVRDLDSCLANVSLQPQLQRVQGLHHRQADWMIGWYKEHRKDWSLDRARGEGLLTLFSTFNSPPNDTVVVPEL